MDNRLLKIAANIEAGKGFVDVGTDHGYIPCFMAESGYSGNIIASDINPLPLNTAVKTAKAAGQEDKIDFILCDGLSKCDGEKVDTIVIAGMGGDLICRILDEAEWCMDKRFKLILQPMTKAEVLRYWLVNNGFDILNEDMARDNKTIYQIIVSRFGGNTILSDGELFTGKYDLATDKKLFLEQLTAMVGRFSSSLDGMESGASTPEYRLRFHSQILSQLEEMRQLYDKC